MGVSRSQVGTVQCVSVGPLDMHLRIQCVCVCVWLLHGLSVLYRLTVWELVNIYSHALQCKRPSAVGTCLCVGLFYTQFGSIDFG